MAELESLLAESSDWPVRPCLRIVTLGDVSQHGDLSVRTRVVGECNRNTPFKALATLLRSFRIALEERPDVVVTTGSMPLALFSMACRLFGARIIWIDSISQIDSLSMSGRLIKPWASQFYVQWPELATRYPGTVYAGELA